ncbi:MAG: class I SAM-dependent methyltransferase [Methylococcaceae bacterium]
MIIREKTNIAGYLLSDRVRHNLVYFLYCIYELRYGKILLNNCGYFPVSLQDDNACQLQLYIELMKTAAIKTTEKITLCELGCGQGHGGIFLLKNYFTSNSDFTGFDISELAITYCKLKYRRIKNASFAVNKQGIPCADESFDVVMSVETSVPRYDENLMAVYRCLKPDGLFVFFETYIVSDKHNIDQQLERHGFEIVEKNNVTDKVVAAFIADHDRKIRELNKFYFLPKKIIDFLSGYMGVVGSTRFENYAQHKKNAFIYVLRKSPNLFIGYAEKITNKGVYGWAHDINSNEPVNISLWVNEVFISNTIANLERQDVAAIHGKQSLYSGFYIPLFLEKDKTYTVQLRYTQTGLHLANSPLDYFAQN